jgi:hypothetical protein
MSDLSDAMSLAFAETEDGLLAYCCGFMHFMTPPDVEEGQHVEAVRLLERLAKIDAEAVTKRVKDRRANNLDLAVAAAIDDGVDAADHFARGYAIALLDQDDDEERRGRGDRTNEHQRGVTIAVLMGFDEYPAGHHNDPAWLYENCKSAGFALTMEDLPRGGMVDLGFAFECATMLTVPVDSHEADSAIHNSQRA